jgi:hypothetical protein
MKHHWLWNFVILLVVLAFIFAACGIPAVTEVIAGATAATIPTVWQTPETGRDEGIATTPPPGAVDVSAYGAQCDGVTNDTDAFAAASEVINQQGGGILWLPPNTTCIVGKQTFVSGEGYRPAPILHLHDCAAPITIMGNGARLRAADGLRFGSFDPHTGEPFTPPELPFTEPEYRADAYNMLSLVRNQSVTVSELELDGNLDGLMLGGEWGDTGRQLDAVGILSIDNQNLTILNVYTHHHGLDGLMIAYYGLTPDSPATPTLLDGVVAEYNARQGLSWVGGIGLTVRNSQFNHTGRARFSSAPGAGVDIEAEDSVNRDGLFENCEFINNTGPGLVADSGDSANITVRASSFWGITNYSIWSNKPFMRFESCDFHGTAIRAYGSRTEPEAATQFVNSTFDDFAHPLYGQPFSFNALVDIEGGDGHNVTFDGCTFTATQSQSLFVLDQDLDDPVALKNSTIVHQYPGEIAATLSGVLLEHVHFSEQFVAPPAVPPLLDAQWVGVGENVVVDGPAVTFLMLTGLIPPGIYPPGENSFSAFQYLPLILSEYSTVLFIPSSADFANPERGFLEGFGLEETTLDWYAAQGYTIAYTTAGDLREYIHRDLPPEYLQSLNNHFQLARKAGIKLIIRFSYNDGETYPNPAPEASLLQILRHIERLAPTLETNKDVIAWFEAGFMGAWGEWHSSTNGLDSDENKAILRDALLAGFPADRFILFRYPNDFTAWYPQPLTEEQAFSTLPQARVGHHNDCFLASNYDGATYLLQPEYPIVMFDEWQSYLHQMGQFVPVSGETCELNPPRTDCPNTLLEMEKLHWTAINEAWHPDVVQGWKDQGCYEEIHQRLGYRLSLLKAAYDPEIRVGDELSVQVELKNTGFASPLLPRPVYLILAGQNETFSYPTHGDPRRWTPGEHTLAVSLPADVPPGNYTLALWLPDASASLQTDPRYALRFANEGVWDTDHGWNVLGTLTIHP